ncbi:unnamed protein product [Durusdinium trenchii]|uniref:Uncharacterized protein n=1 Tax=Durusdinium trenchii TaxID=1381693 RepID=A0ABP0I034_9DINO
MHVMQAGAQALHGGSTLSDGATTLALRSSASKMTHPELMTLLNVATASLGYTRPKYDFVYMPWAKLAFVNFEDHESCKAYFGIFRNVCRLGLENPGVSDVAEAFVQGLAENLAFFISKCGWEAITDARAPLVFEQGEPLVLMDAIDRHVSAGLLAEYQRRLRSHPRSGSLRAPQAQWRAVQVDHSSSSGTIAARPVSSSGAGVVFQL